MKIRKYRVLVALVAACAAQLLSISITHAGFHRLINGDIAYDTAWGNTNTSDNDEYMIRRISILVSQLDSSFLGSDTHMFDNPCVAGTSTACESFNGHTQPSGTIPANSATEYEMYWNTPLANSSDFSVAVRKDRNQHVGYESSNAQKDFPGHSLRVTVKLGNGTSETIRDKHTYKTGKHTFARIPGFDSPHSYLLASSLLPFAAVRCPIVFSFEVRTPEHEQAPLHMIARGSFKKPRVEDLSERTDFMLDLPTLHEWDGVSNEINGVCSTTDYPWIIMETQWKTVGEQPWSSRFFTAHDHSDRQQEGVVQMRNTLDLSAAPLLLVLVLGSALMLGVGYFIRGGSLTHNAGTPS